jgi:putrescine importer
MLLCYVMFPLINVIYVSVTLHRVSPFIPYILAAIFCAAAMTLLNLRGVRATTRVNWALFAAMSLVIAAFVVLAIRYLARAAGWRGFFSPELIYNPHTFDWHSLSTAAAFGILTYLGFDGATTLAEDVENPRRNLPLATVFVVLFTGALGAILVFLGARVWPDYRVFPNLETAFMDVCRRVGGVSMYRAMAAIFVVASFGTGLAAQVGAARLLFGMGREGVLPAGYFGRIDTTRNTAPFNIVLIGIIGFGGALAFSFEQGTDLLNFGAFLAFMSVNVVTFWHFYVVKQHGRDHHFLADALAPLLGLVSCLAVWWGLPRSAMILGTAWIIGGFVIAAMKTRGFKTRPVPIDFEGGS